jgi:hypothetical protein
MEDLRERFTIQDVEAALQEAVALARAGEKSAAREALQWIVEIEPGSEGAWRWLAWCATTRAERADALRRVVAINPANSKARQLLSTMEEPEWHMLWELRDHRYTRVVVTAIAVLLVLTVGLPLGLGAYRESHRRHVEAALYTSEVRKVEAMQTATARAWIIPTWTPGSITRTPSPTNTRVVPQEPAPAVGERADSPTQDPGCCP